MNKIIDVIEVGILTPNGTLASFHLTFFNVDYSEFMTTPGGGEKIRAALERRGLFGYMSSPFLIQRAQRSW